MSGRDFEVQVALKTTPWDHRSSRPARPGFYEWSDGKIAPSDVPPKKGRHLRLNYWDGKRWLVTDLTGKLVTEPTGKKMRQMPVEIPGHDGFWRGLIRIPELQKLAGGLEIPQEHLGFLHADFTYNVSIENLSASERSLFDRYGALLSALITKKVEAVSRHEKDFVAMCFGHRHPKREAERAWKKYLLNVMYEIAMWMEKESCRGGPFEFEDYRARFLLLAKHGHEEAKTWVKLNNGWPQDYPQKADPINLVDIYPDVPVNTFLWRVAGSYGG